MAIACSRLSDSESGEDAKVTGTQKVGEAGKGVLPFFFVVVVVVFFFHVRAFSNSSDPTISEPRTG